MPKNEKILTLFNVSELFFSNGGELGIRTLAGLASSIGFQDRPLQPLG